MIFSTQMAERDARYRYLAILAMVILVPIAFGLFLWAAVLLPWWQALPLGLISLCTGFFVLLKIVDRFLPKKLPQQKDWC
jgi:predicted tellurium resistance membrane protein TerC